MAKKIIIIGIMLGLLLVTGCSTKSNESIDLSNCKKYFDGCNTCAVVDGKITACTEKACGVYQEPKCTEYI